MYITHTISLMDADDTPHSSQLPRGTVYYSYEKADWAKYSALMEEKHTFRLWQDEGPGPPYVGPPHGPGPPLDKYMKEFVESIHSAARQAIPHGLFKSSQAPPVSTLPQADQAIKP